MKFSILAILRICGIICEDTGWFRPYTLMMHQHDGGSSKAVEANDDANDGDYFILKTVGEKEGKLIMHISCR